MSNNLIEIFLEILLGILVFKNICVFIKIFIDYLSVGEIIVDFFDDFFMVI